MRNYFLAAAKATSTVCLIWSAVLLARNRPWLRKNKSPPTEDDESLSPPRRRPRRESLERESMTSESASHSNPPPQEPTIDTKRETIFGQGWSALCRIFDVRTAPTFWQDNTTADVEALEVSASGTQSATQHTTQHQVTHLLQQVSLTAKKVGIRAEPWKPFRKLLPRWSSTSAPDLSHLLHLLVTYTRNDHFVTELLNSEAAENIVHFLVTEAIAASDLAPSSVSESSTSQFDISMYATTYVENAWPGSSETSPTTSTGQLESSAYRLNLAVATILSHLSRCPRVSQLLNFTAMESLLERWKHSVSLHLTLLGWKIVHNLQTQKKLLDGSTKSRDAALAIYHPNVFRLDRADFDDEEAEFDIIFVNGMLGSVFYTWRQQDSILNQPDESTASVVDGYTKCWPRDWLAEEFQRARIIGVDAPLKPFKWNSICPMDRLKRTLDDRSKDVLKQLEAAGVGSRPIVWVTHSAGGILVKEVLRLCQKRANCDARDMEGSGTGEVTDACEGIRRARSAFGSFSAFSESDEPKETVDDKLLCFLTDDDVITSRANWPCTPTGHGAPKEKFTSQSACDNPILMSPVKPNHSMDDCYSEVNLRCMETNKPSRCVSPNQGGNLPAGDMHGVGRLDANTRSIVFISTPHRGNHSLFALYKFPLRWMLTPEAIELERNSEALLDLHIWFNLWIGRSDVNVLTMVEQRVTRINHFWSVLLVPEDHRDRELGEVIRIDSDHLYISKPKTRDDPIYTNVVRFIRNTILNQASTGELEN